MKDDKIDSSFLVSVIIPVFNAELFIAKAVKSAVDQEQVQEVILVEDGSKDRSFKVCQELSKQYNKIKLLQHADKKNHGAGASRNLGIKSATNDFIAFLDADDYYLTDRFKLDKIFLMNDEIDGIYHALGKKYYDKSIHIVQTDSPLTTMSEKIPPLQLFENMSPIGNKGHFSIDTLTVKKRIFSRTGYFNDFKIGEDTLFLTKLAATCQVVGGYIDKPVAMRGIHNNNTIADKKLLKKAKKLVIEELLVWGLSNKLLSSNRVDLLISKLYVISQNHKKAYWIISLYRVLFLLKLAFKCPAILGVKVYYLRFPIIGRFIST